LIAAIESVEGILAVAASGRRVVPERAAKLMRLGLAQLGQRAVAVMSHGKGMQIRRRTSSSASSLLVMMMLSGQQEASAGAFRLVLHQHQVLIQPSLHARQLLDEVLFGGELSQEGGQAENGGQFRRQESHGRQDEGPAVSVVRVAAPEASLCVISHVVVGAAGLLAALCLVGINANRLGSAFVGENADEEEKAAAQHQSCEGTEKRISLDPFDGDSRPYLPTPTPTPVASRQPASVYNSGASGSWEGGGKGQCALISW